MICHRCGKEIPTGKEVQKPVYYYLSKSWNNETMCVKCAFAPEPFYKKWWFWIVPSLILIFILGVVKTAFEEKVKEEIRPQGSDNNGNQGQ